MATAADAAVFTSKQVLQDGIPILCIVHDEEGEWQFLSGHEAQMADIQIISFGQAIKFLPDYDVTFLPKGHQANRKDATAEWEVSIYTEDAL